MAKRRKTSKSAPSRRRRSTRKKIGGLSASSLADVGLVAAGAVVGALISNQLKGQNEYLAAGAPLVAGVLVGEFVKNPMAKSIGLGMAAAGALKLANKVSGGKIGEVIGADDDTIEVEMLSGFEEEMPVMGNQDEYAEEAEEISGGEEFGV